MDTKVKQKKSRIFQTHGDNPMDTDSHPKTKLHNSIGEAKETKACFTLGVRANVQPKSSIPIGAKVEIRPKGFTLGVKAEILKKLFNLPQVTLWPRIGPKAKKRIPSNLGGRFATQKCSKLAPSFFGPNS
jgi:hypothetical protein